MRRALKAGPMLFMDSFIFFTQSSGDAVVVHFIIQGHHFLFQNRIEGRGVLGVGGVLVAAEGPAVVAVKGFRPPAVQDAQVQARR